jgi:hypothetical protein
MFKLITNKTKQAFVLQCLLDLGETKGYVFISCQHRKEGKKKTNNATGLDEVIQYLVQKKKKVSKQQI